MKTLLNHTRFHRLHTCMRVTLCNFFSLKLLPIIQDWIFVGSGGRKQTPKTLALTMATRQITGSQALTEILNGFGHCASHSVALSYETALALLNLKKKDVSIPTGIREGVHTTLIWDNIDFGKETRSGKDTTHIAIGIIIQPEMNILLYNLWRKRYCKDPST